MSDAHRRTLSAVCDTIVPSIEREEDPDGLWAISAGGVGADAAFADLLDTAPEAQLAGTIALLEGLAAQGFDDLSRDDREKMMIQVALKGPEEAAGIGALIGGSIFLTYSLPDPETGQNPSWAALGYPGPTVAPSPAPRPIEPLVPEGDELTLEADAVVVGSGAGGGVIAGTLAQSGMKVVVLEAGGYYDESELPMLELWAYQNLYLRGGAFPTADNNVTVQAGSGLGGGTTINWSNCLRTTDWVREQWANEFGLEGVDGPEYDRHLDAVLERIGANEECSDYNGPTLRLKEGAEKLGLNFRRIVRNADPSTYSPEIAGYSGFGDRSGSKQSHRQDLPARRGRERRRDPRPDERPPGAHRERPRRRSRGALRGPRDRPHGHGHRAGAARRRRLRRARVTGPAAALGDRRAGGRRLPAPAPDQRPARRLRRGPEGLVGRARRPG